MNRTLKSLVLMLGVAVASASAFAQGKYPERPIKLIVPYTPGGTADIVARHLSDELGKSLGQPVVLDFRPGASLILGAQAAAASKGDGYTLFLGTLTSQVLNPILRKSLPYDAEKDFVPVALLSENMYVIAVPASSSAKDLPSFIDQARRRPDELNYGSWGIGNINHLGMERLSRAAKVTLRQVPYKGSAQTDLDLIAGRIDVVLTTPTIMPFVKDGKARALAVTSKTRAPFAPDLPTVAEQGYPGFEVTSWFALFATTGTPPAVVALLAREADKAMSKPEIKDRFAANGLVPLGGDSAGLAQRIAAENRDWGAIADALGIRGKIND